MRYASLVLGLALVLSGCQEQQPGQQGTTDWLARIIAICGSIVGVGGLALGIWNYFWDRRNLKMVRTRLEDKEERKREKEEEAKAKAEQTKERVHGKLSIMGILDEKKESRYVFSVRIYNPTGIVIPIKRVSLIFMDNLTPKREGKPHTKSVDLTPRKTNPEALVKFGPGTTLINRNRFLNSNLVKRSFARQIGSQESLSRTLHRESRR